MSDEQKVIDFLNESGGSASTLDIRRGLDWAVGKVFAVCERMERQGYLSSWEEPGGPERSGRARRFYRVTGTRLPERATGGMVPSFG